MKSLNRICNIFLLIGSFFSITHCDQQAQPLPQNKYEQIFKVIIIIGGYVAVAIGAIIFRLQARQSKVIQFQEVLARGVSSTEHKFEELQQQIDNSAKKQSSSEYESAGGDSTKRKRRKRKADKLSDRRKNNQSNESHENNQQGDY